MSIEIIKQILPTIPHQSGVYHFIDKDQEVLYVGKAKDLRKRITNYTNANALCNRILRMVNLAEKIEIIQTETELEAILLEHNLIKKISPRFNILLKDDKTFPHILISNHQFPQIIKHRGVKTNIGNYFGPFINASDANRNIEILRKTFLLRNCSDSEFKSRKKPCMEYQIKKCSAPCVGEISQENYQQNIKNAITVLSGKSTLVQENLQNKMIEYSQIQEYEKAMIIRDQIKALNYLQNKQNISINEVKDFDALCFVAINHRACVYITFYRAGQNYGSKPYFYELENNQNPQEILVNFIGQFYLNHKPPSMIIVNQDLHEQKLLNEFLSEIAKKKIEIIYPKKGDKAFLLKDHEQLALQNLEQKISHNMSIKKLLMEVKKIFELIKIPQRIEVYDNSHTGNQNAIGAMITAGVDGFIKSGYRKFNIKQLEQIDNPHREIIKEGNDDTAMLEQVLLRRFSKLKSNEIPDFVIIDGGKGQLTSAQKIFDQLNLKIPFVCMSKGKNRNAGEEFFHQTNKESFTLEKNSAVMHYLQRLRDEAHRFAIMTHRKKRDKNMLQ
ncbi:UvrABC system protein C [Alphaproteobacteria bacterium]|nr:UvrABC system protein C [Alphaproteobacteria bacterium]